MLLYIISIVIVIVNAISKEIVKMIAKYKN